MAKVEFARDFKEFLALLDSEKIEFFPPIYPYSFYFPSAAARPRHFTTALPIVQS
jgi:hypothetical protein